jgi:hypothetical protein
MVSGMPKTMWHWALPPANPPPRRSANSIDSYREKKFLDVLEKAK